MKLTIVLKGGIGSGNFGHAGIPGHRGGSAPNGNRGGKSAPAGKSNVSSEEDKSATVSSTASDEEKLAAAKKRIQDNDRKYLDEVSKKPYGNVSEEDHKAIRAAGFSGRKHYDGSMEYSKQVGKNKVIIERRHGAIGNAANGFWHTGYYKQDDSDSRLNSSDSHSDVQSAISEAKRLVNFLRGY